MLFGLFGSILFQPKMINEVLPIEQLAEVLQKIEDDRILIQVVPLVCKLWNDVISDDGFWMSRSKAKGSVLPPKALREKHSFDYRMICHRNPYGRNLIDNPSGESECIPS